MLYSDDFTQIQQFRIELLGMLKKFLQVVTDKKQLDFDCFYGKNVILYNFAPIFCITMNNEK